MYLSKPDIEKARERGEITIEPLFPDAIQPCSVDLHLGNDFLVFQKDKHLFLDPKEAIEPLMREVSIDPKKKDDFFTLHPHEFAIGVIYEKVGVDLAHGGRLDGLSSVGRMGLGVHITASILNPGNTLHITLELYNFLHCPIKLYAKMPIAQMLFYRLSTPVSKNEGYKGFYSESVKPTASAYYKNFLEGRNAWMHFDNKEQ